MEGSILQKASGCTGASNSQTQRGCQELRVTGSRGTPHGEMAAAGAGSSLGIASGLLRFQWSGGGEEGVGTKASDLGGGDKVRE